MKGQFWRYLALTAALMVLLPWLTVKTVRGDAGFAVVLILLYAVDPVYCAAAGAWAGKDIRHLWAVPLTSAALFVAGTWLCFEPGETAFLFYGAIYLGMGISAMAAYAILQKRRKKQWRN